MDFPDLSGIEWPAAIAVALILGGYILRRRWRRQDERMKELQDAKDAYKKAGGTALDAAATVSDFIPGLGTAARVGLNVGQGAASGLAQEFIDNGENANMDNALARALAGAGAAGAGQAVGSKIAGKIPGSGRISKALNSNLGKSALTGAAAGAVGGGLGTALQGGDLGQALAGALQGAQGGLPYCQRRQPHKGIRRGIGHEGFPCGGWRSSGPHRLRLRWIPHT